jgi:nicotinate-nucleotide adenylyltransferase
MRKLCFGGSFNPIHHGHLLCARAAAEAAGFQQVVLIPSSLSPHKLQTDHLADAAHRLEMCRRAVAGDPVFEVSDIEVQREGPSYTIETALELRRQGWDQVAWLIGADMVAILPQWHRPLDLLREVELIIAARPGWPLDWEALPEPFRGLRRQVVEAPLIDISATTIRRRVGAGLSIRYLTPQPICDYIASQGLYRPLTRAAVEAPTAGGG